MSGIRNQEKLCVIGSPVSHSKSPLIHNHWLAEHGIDGEYMAVDVAPEALPGFVRQMREGEWLGCNVTIPHKESVMALLDDINADAKKIGAVNTIVNKDGKLHGTNTDGFGFIEHLKATVPDYNFAKPVMILGAGGAARGIVAALQKEGAHTIYIVNRDMARAEKLQKDFPVIQKIFSWENYQSALPETGLLVNTTSLGMTGQESLQVDLSECGRDCVVYDIVYNPLETELLKQAVRRGLKTVDGLGMLLHQARLSFYHWFGILPEVTDKLRQKIVRAL